MFDTSFVKAAIPLIGIALLLLCLRASGTNAAELNVMVERDLGVAHTHEFFKMGILAQSHFEITFHVTEAGGAQVQIKLAAGGNYGDFDVVDENTFVYYLGPDVFGPYKTDYDIIGTDAADNVEILSFTAFFILATFEDVSGWDTHRWNPGGVITKVTIASEDRIKVKFIQFLNSTGEAHSDSQDFGVFFTLDEAGWINLSPFTGDPIIATADGALYLRTVQTALLEVDLDGDGFIASLDCDDTNPMTYPGASEICDGRDNDCDGSVPAGERDGDGDGFMICAGDCDDSDAQVYPGAPGTHQGKDNDCSGTIETDEKAYPAFSQEFPTASQYREMWRHSLIPLYLERQKRSWNRYQSSHQQRMLTKSVNRRGRLPVLRRR